MSAQARALDRKANKAEKMKVQKDGSVMWTEIEDLAALIRSGEVQNENRNVKVPQVRILCQNQAALCGWRSRIWPRSSAPARCGSKIPPRKWSLHSLDRFAGHSPGRPCLGLAERSSLRVCALV